MDKFRVWCKNKKEYETDFMLLASNSELFEQHRNGSITVNRSKSQSRS